MKKCLSLLYIIGATMLGLQGVSVFAQCNVTTNIVDGMPSYTCSPAGCDEKCKTETPSSTASTSTSPDNRGINMAGCMTGIGCSLDVSELLGLKKNVTNKEDRTSVLTFVQDIILAATFFIGTVVTIAFIYAGFKLIYSSGDSGEKKKAVSGMKNAAIGMVLVAASYAIIRLIQYIAAG